MVPDLTLEVIYLNEPTDFKMEFELCSSSNVRFLSLPVKSRVEFLTAISKSVVRSRAIIAVGSFNPLDKHYIPKIIAKATGYELQEVENGNFGIAAENPAFLPKKSLPLVDENGNLGGCVLENNDQTIIMLTSERELRHNIVSNLVCPYLKLFAAKKTKEFNPSIAQTAVEKEGEAALEDQAPQTDGEGQSQSQEPTAEVDQAPQLTLEEPSIKDEVIEEKPIKEAPTEEILPDQEAEEEQTFGIPNLDKPIIDESYAIPEPPKYSVIEQPDSPAGEQFDLDGFLIEDDYDSRKKSRKIGTLIKILISIILVAAVILGSYFGYDRLFQPMQRDSVYEEIKSLYGKKWDKLPEDMLYKFGKLYQTNSDIFGWLSIPDTSVNHPVVSSSTKSAAYYRSHLFDGSVNRYGTIYTTSASSNADYNRNLIVYGKNMGDGTMFSELESFLDIDKYKNVPTFTFDTLYFENKWKIFSVFKINSKSRSSFLKTSFFDDNEFSEYLESVEKLSAIETNIDVTYSDQIITLVSLGESTDVVMAARRVRDGESPMVDVTGASENYEAADSSDIPVVADPLKPVEDSSSVTDESEFIDQNMVDGASSRYEQQAPVTSVLEMKPTTPTVTSVPDISSSNPSTSSVSSKTSTSSKTSSSKPNTTTTSMVSSSLPIADKHPMLTVKNTMNGKKVKGNALDIIAQNIEAEMGSSYHIEALKAQAVAAYSWLLNNGSANDKYPSLPLKTPSQKCIDAVNAVAGQVAVYKGNIATTYYYAISAGKTSYSENIWSSAIPYLVSVDSSVDKSVKGFQTQRKYSADEIAQKAKTLLKVDLTKITDKNKWFTCSYDVNGLYCTKIKIGNVEKKGTYMRDTFFNYDLRSSAYTIAYNKDEDNFVFTVRGYGHGVGMSQAGANQYAKNGWSYEKILKHYFTGISLGTYYVN